MALACSLLSNSSALVTVYPAPSSTQSVYTPMPCIQGYTGRTWLACRDFEGNKMIINGKLPDVVTGMKGLKKL
jgi:hypothetical protein